MAWLLRNCRLSLRLYYIAAGVLTTLYYSSLKTLEGCNLSPPPHRSDPALYAYLIILWPAFDDFQSQEENQFCSMFVPLSPPSVTIGESCLLLITSQYHDSESFSLLLEVLQELRTHRFCVLLVYPKFEQIIKGFLLLKKIINNFSLRLHAYIA